MSYTITYENVGAILVDRVPQLADAYEKAMYEGKLMVHVFFGYVATFVRSQTKAILEARDRDPECEERIQAIFAVMTRALASGSDKLTGAVMASFLEGLDTTDAHVFRAMVDMMGDELKEAVRELTEFYNSEEWRCFLHRLDHH